MEVAASQMDVREFDPKAVDRDTVDRDTVDWERVDRKDRASRAGQILRDRMAQRIGQERLELWFGPSSHWEFDHNQGASICLESPFLVDCVRSFCLDDLRAVVTDFASANLPIRLSHQTKAAPGPTHPAVSRGPASATKPEAATVRQGVSSQGVSSPAVSSQGVSSQGVSSQGVSSQGVSSQGVSSQVAAARKPLVATGAASAPRSPSLAKATETDWWGEFVVGSSSRLATTALDMVLERPGTLSPLLLYGPSGTGKSHLARAAAQQLRRRCQLRRTILMTAEQFTIDYMESARGAGFASFRRKYRDVDAFILDDLQFCLGKSGTLAELRNTLDNLIRERRQVILVADRSLSELSGLGSDLTARIAGGMTCGLEPLDGLTRSQLLLQLLQKHEIHLPDSTVTALAESAGGDGRALYGIAFRLLTEQRRLGRGLKHDEAFSASLDLIRASQPVVRLADIERVVCENFRLDPKSLQTKAKTKFVSGPRMLAMFLARKHTRAAYSEIGEFFGRRQHSTVISAQKKVEQWIESNQLVPQGNSAIAVRDVLRHLEASLQVG
jgi:chromosomal replication initiator protein